MIGSDSSTQPRLAVSANLEHSALFQISKARTKMLRHLLSVGTLLTAGYWLFIGLAIWAIISEFRRNPGASEEAGKDHDTTASRK
jgi:hypothetical protein